MDNDEKIIKTDKEWEKKLTPEQYRILREKGTESPFSGKYTHAKEKGIYKCAACGNELFSSETKFDSGTGWPSFFKPYSNENIKMLKDASHGMDRVEVVCNRCKSHLGHVFDDGSKTTGKRFCINSCALELDQRRIT